MDLDYEAVFRKSPAPTMVLDRDLKFVAANPAYLKMVGKTEADLLGVYVFEAFPEAVDRVDHMTAVFEAALHGDEPTISEIPFSILIDGVVTEQWWTARHARIDGTDGGEHLIQFSENVTHQVKLRQMRNAMLGELQHRIGNIFAVIAATARATAASAQDVPQFIESFEDRLEAFVNVNHQLTAGAEGEETIAAIVETQLQAHAPEAMDRVVAKGPAFRLSLLQSQAVSMAVHELATNSVKYGALGQPEGRLDISWSTTPDGGGRFDWSETGIRVPAQSGEDGYGAMLLDTIIPSQLNGRAERMIGQQAFTYRLGIGASA